MMESAGFKLVGLGESENTIENKELPDNWNASQDSWSFRYRHNKSSMTFFLKGLKLGSKMLVHSIAQEQDKAYSIELNVDDYVKDDANFDNPESYYKNVDQLAELFKKNIMSKLIPSVDDLRAQPVESQRNVAPPHEPRPHQPYYPSDPLRVGPPRMPSTAPFGIGNDDLLPGPGGGFGFFPGGGNFPTPFGGGGSLVGPRHPGFGIRDPHAPQYPTVPGSFPSGPPGARFDPYGPPGIRPVPDNDHLPPPGNLPDDMYM